jgi:methionyl aminopeptidase
MIVTRSRSELELMERANGIVLRVLDELRPLVKPGATTLDLDRYCERRILELGARPAFKGYRGYPYTLCASVNEQVVHAMPSKRVLKEGDIVGLDLGAVVGGYYGDAAMTLPVGEVSEEAQRLIDVTREALRRGIAAVRVGGRVSHIGAAVQGHVESCGYSVVRDFVGHGVGTQLHEDPQVPNFVDRGRPNPRLKAGMVLALEPMVNQGTWKVEVGEDGWTASTADGSLSAHFERSVLATEDGPRILGERTYPLEI